MRTTRRRCRVRRSQEDTDDEYAEHHPTPCSHWPSPPRSRWLPAPRTADVSISGTVTHTTDLVLLGVTVEVRATGGGGVTFTDGTGQYSFSRARAGNLRVHALAAGLQRTRADG